jgi:LPXTG-motif cell wall-anchored protein
MKFFFLDVVEESWMERHGRNMMILVIISLVALAAIVGFIIWRKKQNKKL